MEVRAAVLLAALVVVGVIVVGTAVLYGAGQKQQESPPHYSSSLFFLSNNDDVPHGVNVTVFDANANRTSAPLYSEAYWLEAGGHATPSIKHDGGGAYRFEISVDGEDPEEFTFSFSRYSTLMISVRMEGAIEALMAIA